MTTARTYTLAFAPLVTLAVAGVACQLAACPLSVTVLFWGAVAGGVHCLAVLVYNLIRN